jgi:hypothetical protein
MNAREVIGNMMVMSTESRDEDCIGGGVIFDSHDTKSIVYFAIMMVLLVIASRSAWRIFSYNKDTRS